MARATGITTERGGSDGISAGVALRRHGEKDSMNTTWSLRRWLACAAGLVSGYVLITVVILGEGAEVPAPRGHAGKVKEPDKPMTDPSLEKPVIEVQETKGDPGDPKEAARMVAAIVNRNQPPKLVWRDRGQFPRRLALFPEKYDWKEDQRVLEALDKLYQDTTVEVWEAMVRRVDDPGYCIITVTDQRQDASMISLGEVCYWGAESRLLDVFDQYLPWSFRFEFHGMLSLHGPSDLAEWRKKRADKSLYQLQIEVGEELLGLLSRTTVFPFGRGDAALKRKITAVVERLRRTKQPIFFPEKSFSGRVYNPESAERVRRAVRTGSSEDIEIVTGP
jgi:hypothetical protein